MKRFLLFFVLLFLIFSGKALASEKFDTSVSSIYNIYENDPTEVIWNFKIKNKTSETIVSKYKLFINYSDAFNISVTDIKGKVNFASKKEKNGRELTLDFDNKVAGVNKEKDFQVKFNSKEIYKELDTKKEVNINRVASSESFKTSSAEVNLPDSFSDNLTILPEPDKKSANKFTFNNLGSGIKILNTLSRVYDLKLNYHLYNQNLFARKMEIAIPSDNSYQEVFIQRIEPQPENIRVDEDGNYLASFILKPSKKLNVKVNEKVKIRLTPDLSETYNFDSNTLVSEKKFWEVNHPKIKSLAKNKSVDQIYSWIISNFKYTSAPNARSGAVESIGSNEGRTSADFVDAFIALSRASGIPARQLQGFLVSPSTLSSKSDELHVWAQYFDDKSKKWIQVDPALNKASGFDYFSNWDLDHIAFVTNGIDSINPKPAGTYKINNSKDIVIERSQQFGLPKPQIKIRTEFNDPYFGGREIRGKIYFKNVTGAKIASQKFVLQSNILNPDMQSLEIPIIPPYGEVAVGVKFVARPLLTNEVDTFKITLGENTLSENVQILPIYRDKNLIIIIFLGAFSVITITIFIIARRARHL